MKEGQSLTCSFQIYSVHSLYHTLAFKALALAPAAMERALIQEGDAMLLDRVTLPHFNGTFRLEAFASWKFP